MEERKTKQHDQMESLVRHFYEIPGKVVMLHDGEYLFHEGDMARYFYIVRSGQIFITKYAMLGRVLSCASPRELPLYEKGPALAVSLLKIMGAHMRKQHSKFRDLLLYGKKGALYSTLIRLANSYGKEMDGGILISVPLMNQELANYSATARESLNRMLSELRKSDIIEYRGHLIFIKDIDYLKEAIQCENCGREICNIE